VESFSICLVHHFHSSQVHFYSITTLCGWIKTKWIEQMWRYGIRDLDLLTVGFVNGMYIESDNDSENYVQAATQKDYDSF
jgi:hypothetical protein